MNIKKSFHYLIYAVATVILGYLLFGNNLFALGLIQLDMSGDGFKNYYTFAYHYQHGSGLWFEGMQYPYGDLLGYADAQALVLHLFKLLKYIGLDITGHELLIVQSLPLIVTLITAIILHNLLTELDVSKYWTIITVIFCLFLSPQLFRFNDHHSLAYTICFPLGWLITIKYINRKLKAHIFLILFSMYGLALGFVHPYHLLMLSVFLLAYFIVRLIIAKKASWNIALAGLLPVILFILVNSWLDPYSDRVTNPYGIWNYKTEVSDIIPFYGIINEFISVFGHVRTLYHEGYSYPGILWFFSPVIILLLYLKRDKLSLNPHLIESFTAGIVCLLFAMGVHLLIGDGIILEILEPLKQFRALGRFSWPFYYTSFIMLSVGFYALLKPIKNKQIRIGLLSLMVMLWSYEAWTYTQKFKHDIKRYESRNLLVEDDRILRFIEDSNYDTNDFQAILPLPVPLEGAEKFIMQSNWFVKMASFPYSLQTGTPMVGAYMSRAPLGNMMDQAQLASRTNIEKTLLSKLDDRPFLTLIAVSDTSEYSDLISQSDIIASAEELLVYATPIAAFNHQLIDQRVLDSLEISAALFYTDFENENDGLLSSGAAKVEGVRQLANVRIDSTIQNLTFSVWQKIQEDKSTVPSFTINLFADEALISSQNYRDNMIKRMDVIKPWVQLNYNIEVPENCNRIEWNISSDYLLIDHAMIIQQNKDFYKKLQGGFALYNDRIVKIRE